MKVSMFGKDDQKSSNERLHKEIIDTYRRLGLLPILTKLFKEVDQKAEALKKELIDKGIPEPKAEEVVEATKQETLTKIILDIRDYSESFRQKTGEKTQPLSQDRSFT